MEPRLISASELQVGDIFVYDASNVLRVVVHKHVMRVDGISFYWEYLSDVDRFNDVRVGKVWLIYRRSCSAGCSPSDFCEGGRCHRAGCWPGLALDSVNV